MRGQPEDITGPEKTMIALSKSHNWGSKYANRTKIPAWQFTFSVDKPYVFNDGITETGNLVKDSHGIPVIVNLDEWSGIKNTIDTADEFRNIYFEVLEDEAENNQ